MESKSDYKKLEELKNITEENKKFELVQSMEKDENKILALDMILDEYNIFYIIQGFKTDDAKVSQLYRLKTEERRARIIEELENDDKKIELLSGILDERNKSKIIQSVKDVDKRIELIDLLKRNGQKLNIVFSINNIKRIKAYGKIDEKYNEIYEAFKKIENKEKLDNSNNKYKTVGLPPQMTVGIEIETVGDNKDILPQPKGLTDEKNIGDWIIKKDNSLMLNGIEFNSPILTDNEEDVSRIYLINETLQKMDMETNEKCGAHVHIGADYIKNEMGFKELVELWGNAEEVYFLISNKPGELPREGMEEYASPISQNIESVDLENIPKDEFLEDVKKVLGNDRHKSLNLTNVNVVRAKNTIEFRLSNGTLDANTWIENIRLYGRTVELASKLGIIAEKKENEEELTEEEQNVYSLKERLKEDISLDEKMDILMQILFSEEERGVYQERYEVNKSLDREEHVVSSMQFGKVDFKNIYDITEVREGTVSQMQNDVREEEQR